MKQPDVTRRPLAAVLLLAFAAGVLGAVRHSAAPLAVERAGGVMPLARSIDLWAAAHPVWGTLACGVCLLWAALIVTRIMLQYSVVRARNYSPLALYIGIATFMMPEGVLSGCLCALLACSGCLCAARSFRKGYRFDAVFRCGLAFGLLPLLCAPTAAMALLLPVMLLALRRRRREIAVALTGFLLPAAFMCYLGWCRGVHFAEPLQTVWSAALRGPCVLRGPWEIAAAVGAGIVWTAAAVSAVLFRSMRQQMRARPSSVMLMLACMLFLMLPLLFAGGADAALFQILAAPLCALVSFSIARGRKWLPAVTYYAIWLGIVASQITLLLL